MQCMQGGIVTKRENCHYWMQSLSLLVEWILIILYVVPLVNYNVHILISAPTSYMSPLYHYPPNVCHPHIITLLIYVTPYPHHHPPHIIILLLHVTLISSPFSHMLPLYHNEPPFFY